MESDRKTIGVSEIRQRAERRMQTTPVDPEAIAGMSAKEMAEMIHELRVHQVELKMQNDELRRIQQELEAARNRYSHLYDFAPVGYLTANEQGIIQEANLTFATMIGGDRSAVVGKPLSSFILSNDQDIYYLHRQRLLASGDLQSCRLRLVKNDGRHFQASLECMIVGQHNDDRRQIRMVATDITQQKKLEWQLQQAQKMEAVAKLAGGVAHQFNNDLFVITASTDLLKMHVPIDDDVTEYLSATKKAVDRMTQLTRQLLAYARGGKYEVQDISPCAFVRNALPLLQHTLEPTIHVETHLPDDIWATRGDASQLLMVLSGILSNAAEAVGADGRIKIACTNERITEKDAIGFPGLQPGSYVCLAVHDDGQGMDPETQKHAFEPFYTTHFTGRGLGLAAAYGIVKNHGGWISIRSRIGRGTCVCVYLPAGGPVEAKKPPRSHSELHRGSGTILLIEDDSAVIDILRKLIERLGYQVIEATTGKEALRLAEEFDGYIDLAIMDVFLPDINGNKLYPSLKKRRPNLKVLVTSGYSIEGPAQEILDAGAEDFIQKPVFMEALSEKLKALLTNEQ